MSQDWRQRMVYWPTNEFGPDIHWKRGIVRSIDSGTDGTSGAHVQMEFVSVYSNSSETKGMMWARSRKPCRTPNYNWTVESVWQLPARPWDLFVSSHVMLQLMEEMLHHETWFFFYWTILKTDHADQELMDDHDDLAFLLSPCCFGTWYIRSRNVKSGHFGFPWHWSFLLMRSEADMNWTEKSHSFIS